MCVLLFAVLAVGALLGPTQASDQYSQLAQNYRAGVDIVLEQLRAHVGIQTHFLFLRSIAKSDIEAGFGASYVFHHFHLKPTSCAKGTVGTATAQTCPFRNDRPLMDCQVCYKMFEGVIDDQPNPPYVHCIHKPKLTREMTTTRVSSCRRMVYTSGSPTLLAVGTKHTDMFGVFGADID